MLSPFPDRVIFELSEEYLIEKYRQNRRKNHVSSLEFHTSDLEGPREAESLSLPDIFQGPALFPRKWVQVFSREREAPDQICTMAQLPVEVRTKSSRQMRGHTPTVSTPL